MYDDPDAITRALARGASIDARWEGWTALTAASQWAWPSVVQLLLSRGAALDVPNNAGETSAMIAQRRLYPDLNALLAVAPTLGLSGWLRRWWLAFSREP